EHLKENYLELNPMAQLPTLVHKGRALAQSMAILIYLDETWPSPPLFPKDLFEKAQVLQICEAVNSGIHPLQNLSLLSYLKYNEGFTEEDKQQWAHHWIDVGFQRLEQLLQKTSGAYSFGDSLTAADLFLIPQVYNARRFKVDLKSYETIREIEERCLQLMA